MKNKKILIGLIFVFAVLLSATAFVSFSSNIEKQEIIIKSITPIYDSSSGVVVEQDKVTFNDKNQVVDYKIVVENTKDYNVKVSDIKLSTPTEEFLKYEIKHGNDIEIDSNSTKEIIISLETTGIKGWGRNFADELTADISFEKVSKTEEVVPPVEEDEVTPPTEEEPPKEDSPTEEPEKEEEKPSEDNLSNKEDSSTNDDIEDEKDNQEDIKEEPVVPDNNASNNIGDNTNVKFDEYINKNFDNYKKIDSLTKAIEQENDQVVYLILGIVVGAGATAITFLIINKFNKKDSTIKKIKTNAILIGLLTSLLTVVSVNAEDIIKVSLKFNVNFESQNIMQSARELNDSGTMAYTDFWLQKSKIKNIYIQNDGKTMNTYIRKYDVTAGDNQRVYAYLVTNKTNSSYYDLYIKADGIIYLNEDASYYFAEMIYLDGIDNIEGIDTSLVTNMSYMFYNTGYNSSTFTLDTSNFNTSKVTNMSYMFSYTGYSNYNFTLDTSKFDTSKVTNMSYMFYYTGYRSRKLITSITISNPNTTSYTNMLTYAATQYGSEIQVKYIEGTENIANKMVATKTGGSYVYIELPIDVDKLSIGDEINIKTEKFNVISQTEDTITVLAKYNLGTNYKQSTSGNSIAFSDTNGWEYTPGPKEIDIQIWSTNPKLYIDKYVSYLQSEIKDPTITGTLMTLKDFENLGCTVPSDYGFVSASSLRQCTNVSAYYWLNNGYTTLTKSADSTDSEKIWYLTSTGTLYTNKYDKIFAGIRPTITISKEALRNYK